MEEKMMNPLTAEELDGLDDLDLDSMTEDELRQLLRRVELTSPVVEEREPEDETSEEYLLWQEDLETLDDYIDELTERLQ